MEWYLGEQGIVSGYAGAIFSGVPTVELARIIDEYVLPDSKLSGVYHVASRPIDKASLLELFKDAYEGAPEVRPVAEPQLNRALIMDRFTTETGYEPPEWPDLVAGMKGADRR